MADARSLLARPSRLRRFAQYQDSSQLQTLSGWDAPTETASAWQIALTAMADF